MIALAFAFLIIVCIESDLNWDLSNFKVSLPLVLLVDWCESFLGIGLVDALADVFSSLSHLPHVVRGTALQSLGPYVVSLEHVTSKVD